MEQYDVYLGLQTTMKIDWKARSQRKQPYNHESWSENKQESMDVDRENQKDIVQHIMIRVKLKHEWRKNYYLL